MTIDKFVDHNKVYANPKAWAHFQQLMLKTKQKTDEDQYLLTVNPHLTAVVPWNEIWIFNDKGHKRIRRFYGMGQ